MRKISRNWRALALPIALTFAMSWSAGEALAKKGGLDDQTRPDDSGGSNSGSSSSGSDSGTSGGSSGGSGSGTSGGRDGYDRASVSSTPTVEQAFEEKWGASLDARRRNDRDFGDRFR